MTALNIHPKWQRPVVVQRDELIQALDDLSLQKVELPRERLINADVAEELLRGADLTIGQIQAATRKLYDSR